MKKLVIVFVMSLLGFLPISGSAGNPGYTGEQSPEQRRLLGKGEIQLVQERLKAEGFDPGPVNGVLTPQTETAIRHYQENKGIPVSGALDEATLREMQISGTPGGGGGR
jgi:membrane-bound lytic murein transglycosylase B